MESIGKRKFRHSEIYGLLFIVPLGVLLHYLYDFTEKSVIGILFGCVNGSIWEHGKVFALTFCVWSIIELACSLPYFRQFIVAKVFALYWQFILMILLMIGYRTLTGNEITVAVVMIISFLATAVAQLLSYRLTVWEKDIRCLFALALGFLFLFFIVFFCFSVVPPHIGIFRDPLTQIYGIIPKNIDVGAYFMNNTEV